jgi:ATP phosphoribosyltransferase-like protein
MPSESGETMRAAGLKAIATVVESTAVLISSKHPSDPKLVSLITNRIKGVITAQKFVLCTYNVERKNLANASKITPGKRAPTVTSLDDEAWVAVQAMVEKKSTSLLQRSTTPDKSNLWMMMSERCENKRKMHGNERHFFIGYTRMLRHGVSGVACTNI